MSGISNGLPERGAGTPRRLYLDNAATSFPKPAAVTDAMVRFATDTGASPGRGSYAESREAAGILRECRERIHRLIGGEGGAESVVFALNATDALNMGIKGVVGARLKAARQQSSRAANRIHLVTTWMDHNSVLRPFNALREFWGELVEVTFVPVDPATGIVDPALVAAAVRDDTALVAVVHASNVTGSIQPVGDTGGFCRERGVLFLVDAAQSLGHVPVDVRAMNIDLLAFPGHKGLLGPLGTGGLYIRPGVEERMVTMREGGTGSVSERDVQPEWMPDRFEAGSHNTIGIAGLSEGVAWLLERGVESVRAHEEALMHEFLSVLSPDVMREAGLRLLGTRDIDQRVGVFALVHEGVAAELFAQRLEEEFGVLVRAGLHCAPLAHRTFGTDPASTPKPGAFRISFGPFVSVEEARFAAGAVLEIARRAPVQVRTAAPRSTATSRGTLA